MKTTKKPLALLLTFALVLTLSGTTVNANADTQTTTDTITVTLKVEDVNSTIVSQSVTLTKEDVTVINNTFTVESGDTEIPVLTSTEFTAAHALGKYVADTSETPAKDLTFSYGSPSHIKGETAYDYYPYWSFRVNNQSPADETGLGYTPDTCPVKDGDSIVFFRQACYDPNAGDWGAYTNYSYFDKDNYEAEVNTPLTINYSKDDGFGYSTSPVTGEEIAVYQNAALVETAATDEKGSATLTFEQAGTYTITGCKLTDGLPENSHASATITVTSAATVPTEQPAPVVSPSVPSPAAPTLTPSAAPTITPSLAPTVTPSLAPTDTPANTSQKIAKPGIPKKLKATVKKKKVTLTWRKAAKADGYQVKVSYKNKKHFKKIADTTKTKISWKAKKGISYVKVRSYRKAGGKKVYSKYRTIKVNVK